MKLCDIEQEFFDSGLGLLLKELKDPYYSTRQLAVILIREYVNEATLPEILDHLFYALKDSYACVREEVVEVLGEIGGAAAIVPLIESLRDSDNEVRCKAVAALGAIGNPTVISPIAGLIDDPDPYIRRNVVVALGQINHPKSTEVLIKALNDTDEMVCCRAAESLTLLGY